MYVYSIFGSFAFGGFAFTYLNDYLSEVSLSLSLSLSISLFLSIYTYVH